MYCRFCGCETADDSSFCSSCGQTLNASQKNRLVEQNKIFYYIFGALFILGGILPYLLMENEAAYSRYLSSVFAQYGDLTLVAVSCFTQFGTLLTPLFRFSACLFSVYLGVLLIKKEFNPTVPLKAFLLLHILTFVGHVIVYQMIHLFPKTVLSFYVHDRDIIDVGVKLIKTEPNLLSFYHDTWKRQCIISIVLVLLACVFGWIHKRNTHNLTDNRNKPAIAGILSMVLAIPVLPVVSTLFPSTSGYSSNVIAAHAIALHTFKESISAVVLFAFVAIVGVVFFFNNTKRWILAVPIIGLIVVFGFLGIAFSPGLITDIGVPEEVMPIAKHMLNGAIIASVAILIAVFFWFRAVSKNEIPTWLQIALPASIPLLYIGIEKTAVSFRADPGYSVGLLSVAFITILVSLLAIPKSSKRTASG